MWRGAAIGCFAELEALALRALRELHPKQELSAKSGDFVAWSRFKRLASAIADPKYRPYNEKILSIIAALEDEHDWRTALAHGRVRATGIGVTLSWDAADKGTWLLRRYQLTWLEAVAALHRIEKLRRDLASQLGQIRRHCASNPKNAG